MFVFNLGKPSSPKGPLEVTDVHKEGCKLSWIKPDDDGGLPIKEYEIEKLDTNTGKWTRVGKVNGERQPPTYNVTGLEPGKSYQFRVTAINDEGDSEPLTTTHAIVAKDPYGTSISYHIIKTVKYWTVLVRLCISPIIC